MLEQGPSEAKILEDCARTAQPYPKSIENAPDLWPGLSLFLSAFLDLSSDRQIGMDVGKIPWSVVDRYCTRYKIEDEQAEDLWFHIRAMDEVFTKHHNKK